MPLPVPEKAPLNNSNPAGNLSLKTEVSRLDCRLMDSDGIYRHYCTLDRVDAETAQLSGVTFPLARSLVGSFIEAALAAGFNFIQYERINQSGMVTRRVKFDLKKQRFISKGLVMQR